MQGKTLPYKEETVYKPGPEMLLPSLGLSPFKMDWGEVEGFPVVWRVKIDIFGNHERCVLRTKAERDHLACDLHSKASIRDCMEVH